MECGSNAIVVGRRRGAQESESGGQVMALLVLNSTGKLARAVTTGSAERGVPGARAARVAASSQEPDCDAF